MNLLNRRLLPTLAVLLSLAASFTYAQGVQTGSLTGQLRTSDSAPVSGAAVTATSPALQGTRTTTTDVNGVYALPSLPPGSYTIKITKSGFADLERAVVIPLGGTATVDATMAVAAVVESVNVEAAAPAAVADIQTSANIVAADINLLPLGRTPFLIAELMPGLTNNTPNAGQITISGGFGYDNTFLVDGVDVNDNLLGTSNDLYIEDAIGEVQVLSSGISAEYGRFSGGVINVITKSGGNALSGSYRTNFTRPSWTSETPFERANGIQRGQPTAANPFITNKLSTVSELTAGGPAVKDRLWLFGAGRFENTSMAGALPQTALPYTKTNDSKRYELKATGALKTGHTLQGTFIDNRVHRANEPVLSFSIDKATFISPSTPNQLGVLSYTGALSPKVLVTAQYSQKHYETQGVGGTATSIVDSPFLTRSGTQFQYNAPLFDASDPEQRNNRQLTGSVSYFASSRSLGSHEFKGGFEDFTDTRVGANSQTSTGYVFQTNFKVDANGVPVLDAAGRAIPVFTAGTSRLQRWFPKRGAEFNMTTVSAYAQDRWVVNSHATLNLGFRYEHATSDATVASTNNVDTNRIVPRLGASYDLRGDGRTVVIGTYGQYSGKYNDTQFSKNTLVGNTERFATVYAGPNGEGRDFAAGFDPANYSGAVASATFPTLNILFDKNLSSPLTHEFTAGATRLIGKTSYLKGLYVQRKTTNFVEDFSQLSNGISNIVVNGAVVGTTDNILYKNSDLPKREYRALEFMGQHGLMHHTTINGQWTVQLKDDGNFEGESPNPTGSPIGDYPEMIVIARSAPLGRLDDFQRSKIRLWGNYDLALGTYGSLNITPLWRYNSGKTYSLFTTAPLSTIQSARNPGYANTVTQTLFFGDRGSQSFKGYGLFDLALTYDIPVWHTARPWIKVESFNLLNNQKLISWDTTVTADANSVKDADGLATGYLQGARFGTGTSNSNYPAPRPGLDGGRMVDFAVGLRF